MLTNRSSRPGPAVRAQAAELIVSQEKYMRSLFIVISKVYGLVQAYTGISYIFMLIPMFRMLRQQAGAADTTSTMITTFHGEPITLSIISYSSMIVLTFGLAWLLIFKADWLADKMKIPPTDFPTLYPVGSLIYAGTKLIGLYIIVQGTPLLIQVLYQMGPRLVYGGYMWSSIVASAIRIVIGLILLLKTRIVMDLIIGKDGQKQSLEATP